MQEVRGLHESHIGKVEVAQKIVFVSTSPLLVWTGQVDAAGVTSETLLVVIVIVVEGTFCKEIRWQLHRGLLNSKKSITLAWKQEVIFGFSNNLLKSANCLSVSYKERKEGCFLIIRQTKEGRKYIWTMVCLWMLSFLKSKPCIGRYQHEINIDIFNWEYQLRKHCPIGFLLF